MSHKEIRVLKQSQELYNRSKANLDVCIRNRSKAIAVCLNSGFSVQEIANVLQLSRQRVYKIIEKDKVHG
tara:strand:- start:38 stop:247 length:210 start_codon:yes stop_codon:yes gene_type:complete